MLAQPISLRDQLTLDEPFTALPVLPTVIVRAVPQVAVVIPAEPSKFVPLMERVLANLVAAVAVPAAPEMLIGQVPEAPDPVALGTPISDRDQLTSVEPFTLLLVLPIVIVLAVPHVAVVIPAEPSKFVPLIDRVLVNLLAELTIALAILPE